MGHITPDLQRIIATPRRKAAVAIRHSGFSRNGFGVSQEHQAHGSFIGCVVDFLEEFSGGFLDVVTFTV
jgi:hypothetical protein